MIRTAVLQAAGRRPRHWGLSPSRGWGRRISTASPLSLVLGSEFQYFDLAAISSASATIRAFQQRHHHHQYLQRRSKSVFVSRHNHSLHVTRQILLEYLASRGVDGLHQARSTPSHLILRECPFCEKPTNNKADNLYKMYVQIGSGAYFCHRCGAGGSWFDLKAQLGGGNGGGSGNGTATPVSAAASLGYSSPPSSFEATATGRSGTSANPKSHGYGRIATTNLQSPGHEVSFERSSSHVPCLPMPPRRLQAVYSTDLFTKDEVTGQINSVLDYLVNTRGLTQSTLRKYGVGKAHYAFPDDHGQWVKADCVTFSWIMSLKDIEYQESLRGAKFVYENHEPPSGIDSSTTAEAKQEGDKGILLKSSDPAPSEDSPNEDKSTATDAETPVDPKEQVFVTRRIKARALEQKAWQRLDPPGGAWGFFGYHTIPRGCKEVVLTEGEYDAMAVYQATGRHAISLPNGCRSLPIEVLPLLEDFDKIYLWMDSDGPGQEGAELFARKIGLERCYLVRPTLNNTGLQSNDQLPKDANEALLRGLDLDNIVADAKLTPHERILSFDDLRQDVLHEILHPDQYAGVPLPSLPKFTQIIKGLRRGELTVVTGPTGSGKTTFLGQMSLDLAEQDVNVLWGSFEIKNTRLMHKLLQQFAREPLLRNGDDDPSLLSDRLHALADRFAQLPLHFLKFHGGSDVDDVLDAMEYAVYVNDVQHIILDNMQFMICRQSTNNNKHSTWDKFDIQDIAVRLCVHST